MKLRCCVRCYVVVDDVGENEEEGWLNMEQKFVGAKVRYYNNEEYISFCFLKSLTKFNKRFESLTKFNKNEVGEEKYDDSKKSI